MDVRRISLVLATCLVCGCAELQPTQELTSSELLANPSAFEGKRVKIQGHIAYGFENCAIDGKIWYWPQNDTCYGMDSLFDAWEGNGYVVGVVSMSNHGHLGIFPFSLVKARVVRQ